MKMDADNNDANLWRFICS